MTISFWDARPEIRDLATALVAAGESYTEIRRAIAEQYSENVTDSAIYRLRKGLAEGRWTAPEPEKAVPQTPAEPTPTPEPAPAQPDRVSFWDRYPEARDFCLSRLALENTQIMRAYSERFPEGPPLTTSQLSKLRKGVLKGRWDRPRDRYCPVGREGLRARPRDQRGRRLPHARLPDAARALLSEERTICLVRGVPSISLIQCLRYQAGKGAARYESNGWQQQRRKIPSCRFSACRCCARYLTDEDYDTVKRAVKAGLSLDVPHREEAA